MDDKCIYVDFSDIGSYTDQTKNCKRNIKYKDMVIIIVVIIIVNHRSEGYECEVNVNGYETNVL